MDIKLLTGSYLCTDVPGEFVWQDGLLTMAARAGRWLVVEDIHLMPSEIIDYLNVMFETKQLYISSRKETVFLHDDFFVFSTTTKNAKFLSEKFLSWNVICRSALSIDEIKRLLQSKFHRLSSILDLVLSLFSEEPLNLTAIMRACARIDCAFSALKGSSYQVGNPLTLEDRSVIANHSAFILTSKLSDDHARERLWLFVADALSLPQSELRSIFKEARPLFQVFPDSLQVGDVVLPRGVYEYQLPHDFALSSYSLRLMERIMLGLHLKEALLLVGETGTGKTTVVQSLAKYLKTKLSVVNLHLNLESGDLLGGYKPCSVFEVIKPSVDKFKELLGKLISKEKMGEIFLRIDEFRRKNQPLNMLLLLEKTLNVCIEKLDVSSSPTSIIHSLSSLLCTVSNLRIKFSSTDGIPSNNFIFSEGALTKAFRHGYWILLDEINLATSEVLEALDSILSSSSSGLLLLDKGGVEVVPRHENFRIFGCMNPQTDSGKKALPPSISRRFTEIYVDPLENYSKDLLFLINHSVKGIVTTVASKGNFAVDFSFNPFSVEDATAILNDFVFALFYRVKECICDSSLIDGSGHRPQFSLRTLTRCFAVAKYFTPFLPLLGAIHESFQVVFCSQLTETSRALFAEIFVNISQNLRLLISLPVNGIKKEVYYSSSSVSKSDVVDVNGYFLKKGQFEFSENSSYIITASVRQNMKCIARVLMSSGYPILLQGPTSAGKTSLIEHFGKITGNNVVRINNHEHTDVQEYYGSYSYDQNGDLVFSYGLLVNAIKKGYWIILDELNLAPSEVLESLNRLLDDNNELYLLDTDETFRPHPNFRLFATQNPSGDLYGGRKILSRAFRNRFIEIFFEDIPANEIETIVSKSNPMLAPSFAKKISSVYSKLIALRSSTTNIFARNRGFVTLRDLFKWARRSDLDTYQKLAENGYCLFAERLRNSQDKSVIKSILEDVFKVEICPEAIYSYPALNLSSGCDLAITKSFRRLYSLVMRCISSQEPILLVGETGTGKTSICQWISKQFGVQLNCLNCHQYTEASDFIGIFRPMRPPGVTNASSYLDPICAAQKKAKCNTPMFKWVDGPLVDAMKFGKHFLIDEISLAEDAVLERLNSVLEPARSLTIPEFPSEADGFIEAARGFAIFATMNPGGDFGKRELSPALRNRFTEIWVPPIDAVDDLSLIMRNALTRIPYDHEELSLAMLSFIYWFMNSIISKQILNLDEDISSLIQRVKNESKITLTSPMYNISLRDIISWAAFMENLYAAQNDLGMGDIFIEGVKVTFLDGLGFVSPFSSSSILLSSALDACLKFSHALVSFLNMATNPLAKLGTLSVTPTAFSIAPYSIPCTNLEEEFFSTFSLNSGTVVNNLTKLLRALMIPKPLLLEGNPGVGKTTTVMELARLTGKKITRINLSEQTDLTDLYGMDVPTSAVDGDLHLLFKWNDGPFLTALKEGHWIILDEINLASQSVLEGLNAALDHRGSIFIPELNSTFEVSSNRSRIFATQNPSIQGCGRKGLPKSFLNRFTRIFMDPFVESDIIEICKKKYPKVSVEVVEKIVRVIYAANAASLNPHVRLGSLGGPWDYNLRDISRILRLFLFLAINDNPTAAIFRSFYLVIVTRMRSMEDKEFLVSIFKKYFTSLVGPVISPWTFSGSTLSIGRLELNVVHYPAASHPFCKFNTSLESLLWAIHSKNLAILTGKPNQGKLALISYVAALSGNTMRVLNVGPSTETSSFVGSFEQFSRSDLKKLMVQDFFFLLSYYSRLLQKNPPCLDAANFETEFHDWVESIDLNIRAIIGPLLKSSYQKWKASTLVAPENNNEAGSFHWVDGILVDCLKNGHWLVLKNANLCTSSVLDRINCLFEDDSLTFNVHERPDSHDSSISIHPNFRMFFIMDIPERGHVQELSRAMRNRAVEIYFPSTPNDSDELDSLRLYLMGGIGENHPYFYRTLNGAVHFKNNIQALPLPLQLTDDKLVAELSLNETFSVDSKDNFEWVRLAIKNYFLDYSLKFTERSKALDVLTRQFDEKYISAITGDWTSSSQVASALERLESSNNFVIAKGILPLLKSVTTIPSSIAIPVVSLLISQKGEPYYYYQQLLEYSSVLTMPLDVAHFNKLWNIWNHFSSPFCYRVALFCKQADALPQASSYELSSFILGVDVSTADLPIAPTCPASHDALCGLLLGKHLWSELKVNCGKSIFDDNAKLRASVIALELFEDLLLFHTRDVNSFGETTHRLTLESPRTPCEKIYHAVLLALRKMLQSKVLIAPSFMLLFLVSWLDLLQELFSFLCIRNYTEGGCISPKAYILSVYDCLYAFFCDEACFYHVKEITTLLKRIELLVAKFQNFTDFRIIIKSFVDPFLGLSLESITAMSLKTIGLEIIRQMCPLLPFDPASIDYTKGLFTQEKLTAELELSKVKFLHDYLLHFNFDQRSWELISPLLNQLQELPILAPVIGRCFPSTLTRVLKGNEEKSNSLSFVANFFATEEHLSILDMVAPLKLASLLIQFDDCCAAVSDVSAEDRFLGELGVHPLHLSLQEYFDDPHLSNIFFHIFDVHSSNGLESQLEFIKSVLEGRILLRSKACKIAYFNAWKQESPINPHSESSVFVSLKAWELLQEHLPAVKSLLYSFSEHAGLQQILLQIEYVFNLKLKETPTAELTRTLESLLNLLAEWNQFSASFASLDSFEKALIELIIYLRKIELEYFSENLFKSVEKDHKICSNSETLWKYLVKILDWHDAGPSPSPSFASSDFLTVFNEFFLSCSLGDFSLRITMLKDIQKIAKYFSLPSVPLLNNLLLYYEYFDIAISAFLSQEKAKLAEKFDDFIKIARWNDLNSLALKQSTDTCRAKIKKYSKAWQDTLQKPCVSIILISPVVWHAYAASKNFAFVTSDSRLKKATAILNSLELSNPLLLFPARFNTWLEDLSVNISEFSSNNEAFGHSRASKERFLSDYLKTLSHLGVVKKHRLLDNPWDLKNILMIMIETEGKLPSELVQALHLLPSLHEVYFSKSASPDISLLVKQKSVMTISSLIGMCMEMELSLAAVNGRLRHIQRDITISALRSTVRPTPLFFTALIDKARSVSSLQLQDFLLSGSTAINCGPSEVIKLLNNLVDDFRNYNLVDAAKLETILAIMEVPAPEESDLSEPTCENDEVILLLIQNVKAVLETMCSSMTFDEHSFGSNSLHLVVAFMSQISKLLPENSPSGCYMKFYEALLIWLADFIKAMSHLLSKFLLGNIMAFTRLLKEGLGKPKQEDQPTEQQSEADNKAENGTFGMDDISKDDIVDENTKNVSKEMECSEQVEGLQKDVDDTASAGDQEDQQTDAAANENDDDAVDIGQDYSGQMQRENKDQEMEAGEDDSLVEKGLKGPDDDVKHDTPKDEEDSVGELPNEQESQMDEIIDKLNKLENQQELDKDLWGNMTDEDINEVDDFADNVSNVEKTDSFDHAEAEMSEADSATEQLDEPLSDADPDETVNEEDYDQKQDAEEMELASSDPEEASPDIEDNVDDSYQQTSEDSLSSDPEVKGQNTTQDIASVPNAIAEAGDGALDEANAEIDHELEIEQEHGGKGSRSNALDKDENSVNLEDADISTEDKEKRKGSNIEAWKKRNESKVFDSSDAMVVDHKESHLAHLKDSEMSDLQVLLPIDENDEDVELPVQDADPDDAVDGKKEESGLTVPQGPNEGVHKSWQISNSAWTRYANETYDASLLLTEQLRHVLEPTLAGKLEGDFKTGKRLNMRKILPYIASGFRKDKIWLRRTKPSKRQYQVLLSVDQSKSMSQFGIPDLTFQTLALLAQSLSRLEVGALAISVFGDAPVLLHSFDEPWNDYLGNQLLMSMTFQQEKTNLEGLLKDSLLWFRGATLSTSSNGREHSQIHFILTDGVFQDLESSRKQVRTLSQEGIFTVFLILDPRPAKESILEMKNAVYHVDPETGKPLLTLKRYLDAFPSDYYLVLRNLEELPSAIAQALTQWMELLKSKSI